MSSPLPDVLARHPDLPCLKHPALRSALESGQFIFGGIESVTNTIDMRRIYGARADLLASRPGRCAKQQRESLLSFCAALGGQPTRCKVSFTSICFENGLIFNVWERADTHELLGCYIRHVTGTLTDADWERLWRGD